MKTSQFHVVLQLLYHAFRKAEVFPYLWLRKQAAQQVVIYSRSSSFLFYDHEESYLLCLEREKLCFGRLVKFSFTITVERDEVALLNFLYTGEKQDNKSIFSGSLKFSTKQ